jgi:hypothetical protein
LNDAESAAVVKFKIGMISALQCGSWLSPISRAAVIVGLEPDGILIHDPEMGADRKAPGTHFCAAWDRRQRKGFLLWKP